MRKWYRGDLHTHTTYSDGLHSIEEAVSIAQQTGLDFIVLSDHNTYLQNHNLPKYKDFTLIPGIELTTPKGHCNFMGLETYFEQFDFSSDVAVQQLFEEGYKKGAFISINHPFVGDKWQWGFDDLKFQAIEIWNGSPVERNRGAVAWWQEQLCKGKRILATGGSDVHKQGASGRWYGQGNSLVLAEHNDLESIMRGLHAGHVCVASHPDASSAFCKMGSCEIGDTYFTETDETKISMSTILNLKGTVVFKIYGDAGLVHEKVFTQDKKVYHCELPSMTQFYRIELWHLMEDSTQIQPFFTNPIYLTKK